LSNGSEEDLFQLKYALREFMRRFESPKLAIGENEWLAAEFRADHLPTTCHTIEPKV
jgi:hypothetical protein